jgi:hypothetical protein
MLICSLIRCLLLLGTAGWSIATLPLASQPTSNSTPLTTKTSTPGGFGTSNVVGLSNQAVSVGDKKLMKSLDSYQWKNRLLLIFAPSENSAAYQQQRQLLQGQQAGLNERDLLIFELLAQGTSHVNGQNIDAEEVAKIRDYFKVSAKDFRVVLVGKDGTAKQYDKSPVSPTAIFTTIDAMPMRRQEMNLRRN